MWQLVSSMIIPITFIFCFSNILIADGNITVELNGIDLVVTGQNNTDQTFFMVAGPNAGEVIFLAGDEETTINGNHEILVAGFIGDCEMDLKTGEKIVVLSEQDKNQLFFHGDLSIEARGNKPVILLLDSLWVQGEAAISTRNGSDAIIINDSSFRQGLDISTGQQDDVVFMGWQVDITGNLGVATGSGDDYVVLYASLLHGYFDVSTSSGNDTLGIYNSRFFGGIFDGGSGNDSIGRAQNFGRSVYLGISVEGTYDNGIWGLFNQAYFSNPIFAIAVYFHNILNLYS